MVKKCFIPSCVNTNENCDKIFITVPKRNLDLRKKWFATFAAEDADSKAILHCCEDHFDLENDAQNWTNYMYKMTDERLRLRKSVVPHINIFSPKPRESQLTASARKRKAENIRSFVSAKKLIFEAPDKLPICEDAADFHEIFGAVTTRENAIPSTSSAMGTDIEFCEEMAIEVPTPIEIETVGEFSNCNDAESAYANQYEFVEVENVLDTNRPTNKTKGTQVNMCNYIRSIGTNTETIYNVTRGTNTSNTTYSPVNKETKSLLNTTTSTIESSGSSFSPGQSSEEISEQIEMNSINEAARRRTIYLIERNSRFYLGLPEDAYFITETVAGMMDVLHFFVTLKKIRLDYPYTALADDFGMSESDIDKIFNKSVPKLAAFFKQFINWPDKGTIKKTLPIAFRCNYSEVQSIIDCFEIEIEQPSNPLKQALTWSEYKECNTIKYFVSATPNGLVNFLSCGFGGQTTDKMVVEKSGYLDALPENCGVMADKGFKHIAIQLSTKGCTFISPASVRTTTRSSREEAYESRRRIAALRILIDRVITRFREFAMLGPHAVVNHNHLYLLDCIVNIVGGLVNFQQPIIL